jgi:hypothetical protein
MPKRTWRFSIRRFAAIILAAAFFGGPCISIGADCGRRAVVTNATTNDPFFAKDGGKTLLLSVHAFLGEVLTTANFNFLDKALVEDWAKVNPQRSQNTLTDYHPEEYHFKVSYQIGLNESRKGEKPIVSRLQISVYYNGDSEELVKSWSTESPLNDYESHVNRMFRTGGVMRMVKPIEEVLWDFERAPVSCKVDLGKTKTVKPGEEIEIELSEFRDAQGRKSKPFNRIVLQARDGKIQNGTSLETDEKLKAFRIGDSPITIKYKAPEVPGAGEDVIWINSSCEILPEDKFPMSKTDFIGSIKEQRIPVVSGIKASILETSSGMCDDGSEHGYPFSYTVSMDFVETGDGARLNGAAPGPGADLMRNMVQGAAMPQVVRKLAAGKEARLVAVLLPMESSMSVKAWQCTDPENNGAPPARFPRGKAGEEARSAGVEMWVIGDKLYIVKGFLGGILGYFPGWDEITGPSGYAKQPLGARVDITWGDMGEYLEIPLDKCKQGQTLTINKAHSGTDSDVWSWRTNWTVRIIF